MATRSRISVKTAATYAQLLVDAGFDRVELLSGAVEDFDEGIGERIPSVIHRRLLKSAVRSLAESAALAEAAPAAMAAEAMTNTSTEASPAALALKLHVNGPGGPICSVSLDAASKLTS